MMQIKIKFSKNFRDKTRSICIAIFIFLNIFLHEHLARPLKIFETLVKIFTVLQNFSRLGCILLNFYEICQKI